jgi:two-component system KDP operon response regulator KdpE
MRYLRQKLESDPSRPQYLLTQRGVGYRFQKQIS